MHDDTPSHPPPPATRHEKMISGATFAESEDLPPEPLPMTLWLRGDESYCGSFSLDADGVMEQLGIKRTRLTQISGRELRVGKIKRGRYIVPVYRPDDVEQYLSWSRATATHLKSTQAVTAATENLKDQTSLLFQKTETLLQNLSDTMAEDLLSRVAQPLAQLLVQALAPTLEKQIQNNLKNLAPLVDHLESTLDQNTKQAFWRVAEQQVLFQRNLGKRFDTIAADVTTHIKTVKDSQHHHQAASVLLLERTSEILAVLSHVKTQLQHQSHELETLTSTVALENSQQPVWPLSKPQALRSEVRRITGKNHSPGPHPKPMPMGRRYRRAP